MESEKNYRDLALFVVGIDSALRVSDLLQLKVGDIVGSLDKAIRSELFVNQQKTQNPVTIHLSPYAQSNLVKWIKASGKMDYEHLFTGLRKSKTTAITSNCLRRLVKRWAKLANLNPEDYSCHSLRRSRATIFYEGTGNIEATRIMLGHRNVSSTSTYLSVSERQAVEMWRRYDDIWNG